MLAVCIPGFVVAPLLILTFSIKLRLLPVALWESPWHMILPPIALGLFFAGQIARIFREGMLQATQSEFVTAARAKGLGENTLLIKHAVRIGHFAGGFLFRPDARRFAHRLVHHRKHFSNSGHRRFSLNSSLNRDYTVVVGLSLLYAMLLIALNLMVDFAYTLLDPRVKYE